MRLAADSLSLLSLVRHLIDAFRMGDGINHVQAVGWKTPIVTMGHEASGVVWIRRLHHT